MFVLWQYSQTHVLSPFLIVNPAPHVVHFA